MKDISFTTALLITALITGCAVSIPPDGVPVSNYQMGNSVLSKQQIADFDR